MARSKQAISGLSLKITGFLQSAPSAEAIRVAAHQIDAIKYALVTLGVTELEISDRFYLYHPIKTAGPDADPMPPLPKAPDAAGEAADSQSAPLEPATLAERLGFDPLEIPPNLDRRVPRMDGGE